MKKILKTTGTIGTAAALSLGAAACSKTPPAPNVPPSDTASTGGTEAAPEATAQANDDPNSPDYCKTHQFTEACGYASPTKYAALDPAGIRNS
jgi:hypothetical protein